MRINFILTSIIALLFFLRVDVLVASPSPSKEDPEFLSYLDDAWVNQKMEELSIEEKIAQLMMVAVYPREEEAVLNNLINSFGRLRPGGIVVMQGPPVKSARWINTLNSTLPIPLLVAVDGEWGLPMRIDSTSRYPFAQALGAVQDSSLIHKMGCEMAEQLKMMGIKMNFAPVADINTNSQNPVINFRSFGESKMEVTKRAEWIAKGMQDNGVMAVAKHFPGHGDSETDSHLELPLINHSKERIDELESFPFRHLINRGISGIMTGHLNVPSLDPSGVPSTLSKNILDGYLRKEIGFKGLVITDAINMDGVQLSSKRVEVDALKAGNDIVLFVPDAARAVASVKQAVDSGEITEEMIDDKCRRVLAAKRWAGLDRYEAADLNGLTKRLNSNEYKVTGRKLFQESLTVLVNKSVLPIEDFDKLKIASVMIGRGSISPFQNMMNRYAAVDHFTLAKEGSEDDLEKLIKVLENYNLVLLGIEGINIYPAGKYGTSEIQRRGTAKIIDACNTVALFFGNGYALKHFENIDKARGVVLAYQNNIMTQELAAQLLFGAFDANGKLPITIDHRFKVGDGVQVKGNRSFSYSIPEEVGISSEELTRKIDSLALLGIEERAYPGCQVLIAVHGKVVFHKCYGYHTYFQEQEVEPDNLYDLASVTKVTAPLPALMKLVDEGKIAVDKPFSDIWPDFKSIDKGRFTLREYLAHQAHLPAWIPFWQMGLDENGELSDKYFSHHPKDEFNVRVSDKLYVNSSFKEAIYDTIKKIKILPVKRYLYSDLSFHLYPEIVEDITGTSFEKYVKENFYKPMGANSLTYNPYLSFPMEMIIPTEIDDFFRNEKLRGFVHDEGAAVLGGISGNAGLFGTANDLAKIFQMYIQGGYFAGRRYISEVTVKEFTRVQFPGNRNRRGMGFDKPLFDNNLKTVEAAYPAVSVRSSSFGHTGYTGTMVWADPDTEVLFVFLSNRVYPTRENAGLSALNIRTAMHQAIYDCLRITPEKAVKKS